MDLHYKKRVEGQDYFVGFSEKSRILRISPGILTLKEFGVLERATQEPFGASCEIRIPGTTLEVRGVKSIEYVLAQPTDTKPL